MQSKADCPSRWARLSGDQGQPSARIAIATTVLLMVLFPAGCGRGPSAGQAQASGSAPNRSVPAVELSPNQLHAITIGPAQIYRFSIEKDVPGSISYADDPSLIQAESAMLAASATYDLTRKELSRVKSLGITNGIAQKDLEQAVSDAQTAAAAYKAARDAVRALGKTDVEIDRMVAAGRIESSKATRLTAKWAIANVVEIDSALFHAGQPVRVSVAAFPDKLFAGAVSEAYSTIDPNTHRETIRAEISDPENELRPGMLADIFIEIRRPEVSIGIPENGVVREGDGTMTAWVTIDRRRFQQRVVQTGLRENGRVQILKGLRSGELAVMDGALFLDNMLNAPPSD